MKERAIYLDKISSGEKKKLLEIAYKDYYPIIKKYILSTNGNEADAMDIFQDSMFHIIKESNVNNTPIRNSFKNYLISVSKNLWFNEMRKRSSRKTYVQDHNEIIKDGHSKPALIYEMNKIEVNEVKQFMIRHINALDPSCREVINMYMNQVPMEIIALRMGYKNKQIAKNKKCACQKRLSESITNDREFKNLFK